MPLLLGVIGWLAVLAPVIYRFVLFVTQKILPKFAKKGATAGTVTIGATLIGYLSVAGCIAPIALAVYLFHVEMFSLVRDYVLPVFGFILTPLVNAVLQFLPSADNVYFSFFMGFFNAIGIAEPLSILVLFYCFSSVLGLYMRTFKI